MPMTFVDWLLDHTVFSHEEGKLLDPACGSGSFLVRYVHRCLSDAKDRGLAPEEVCHSLQINVWICCFYQPFSVDVGYGAPPTFRQTPQDSCLQFEQLAAR